MANVTFAEPNLAAILSSCREHLFLYFLGVVWRDDVMIRHPRLEMDARRRKAVSNLVHVRDPSAERWLQPENPLDAAHHTPHLYYSSNRRQACLFLHHSFTQLPKIQIFFNTLDDVQFVPQSLISQAYRISSMSTRFIARSPR